MKPLTIIIFGATGDLFKRKLSRALFELYLNGQIAEKFTVIGLSRKQFSHGEFRDYAKECIGVSSTQVEDFLAHFFYYSIDVTDLDSLKTLRGILDNNDRSLGICSNKLLYVATVPDLYGDIFQNIKKAGLSISCAPSFKEEESWIRIVVEKPFGTNEHNALIIDEILSDSFDESQIFRIDHYLAKETLQHISSFRFENALFEHLWSHNYVESVYIRALETIDISGRENFYDKVGAIKDFGQNHLLQMLALVSMEEPENNDVRKVREKILKQTYFKFKDKEDLVIGQYEGYRDVIPESQTETYFKAKLYISSERWKDVPFFIEHGKAVKESISDITVLFKKNDKGKQNKVVFKIQPNPEICASMFFNSLDADDKKEEIKEMCFPLRGKEDPAIYPYEKLLLDAILGDQTLFVSTEEIKEEWRITSEIQSSLSLVPLLIYKKGDM